MPKRSVVKAAGEYVYHGTRPRSLPSIQQNGLQPRGGRLYFTDLLHMAAHHSRSEQPVILRVRRSDLPESAQAAESPLYIDQPVPPERIERQEGEQWVPLTKAAVPGVAKGSSVPIRDGRVAIMDIGSGRLLVTDDVRAYHSDLASQLTQEQDTGAYVSVVWSANGDINVYSVNKYNPNNPNNPDQLGEPRGAQLQRLAQALLAHGASPDTKVWRMGEGGPWRLGLLAQGMFGKSRFLLPLARVIEGSFTTVVEPTRKPQEGPAGAPVVKGAAGAAPEPSGAPGKAGGVPGGAGALRFEPWVQDDGDELIIGINAIDPATGKLAGEIEADYVRQRWDWRNQPHQTPLFDSKFTVRSIEVMPSWQRQGLGAKLYYELNEYIRNYTPEGPGNRKGYGRLQGSELLSDEGKALRQYLRDQKFFDDNDVVRQAAAAWLRKLRGSEVEFEIDDGTLDGRHTIGVAAYDVPGEAGLLGNIIAYYGKDAYEYEHVENQKPPPAGTVFMVNALSVAPDYRRQGLASKLYYELGEYLRSKGYRLRGGSFLLPDGAALRHHMRQSGFMDERGFFRQAAADWLGKGRYTLDPDTQEARNAIQNLGSESGIPPKRKILRISELLPTQVGFKQRTVDRYNRHPEDAFYSGASGEDATERPHVVRYNNKYWIEDGHHRVEAARQRGDEFVEVNYHDLDGLSGWLGKAALLGPGYLYHGTESKHFKSIQASGLTPDYYGQRVYLSGDEGLSRDYSQMGEGGKEGGLLLRVKLSDIPQARKLPRSAAEIRHEHFIHPGMIPPEKLEYLLPDGQWLPLSDGSVAKAAGDTEPEEAPAPAQRGYITDDNGQPLTVYHGTPKVFEQFQSGKPKKRMQLGLGIHFAEDREFAQNYATGKKGRVIPAKLRASKVLTLEPDNGGTAFADEGTPEFAFAQALYRGTRWAKIKIYHIGGEPSRPLRACIQPDLVSPAKIEQAMRQTGFDAIRYTSQRIAGWRGTDPRNMSPIIGQQSKAVMVLDPDQIETEDPADKQAFAKAQRPADRPFDYGYHPKPELEFQYRGPYNGELYLVDAVLDGTLVGHLSFSRKPEESDYHVVYIEVQKPHRRQGIAGRLYQEAAALARKLGRKLVASDYVLESGQAFRDKMRSVGAIGDDLSVQLTAASWLQKRAPEPGQLALPIPEGDPGHFQPTEHERLGRLGQDPGKYTGKAPKHDWNQGDEGTNNGGPWSEENARAFAYGGRDNRGKSAKIYRAMVPLEQLIPELWEESGYYEGDYDWSELRSKNTGAPPVLVMRDRNGNVSLLDGNHRSTRWKAQGYELAPAWVVDEQLPPEGKAAPAPLRKADKPDLFLQLYALRNEMAQVANGTLAGWDERNGDGACDEIAIAIGRYVRSHVGAVRTRLNFNMGDMESEHTALQVARGQESVMVNIPWRRYEQYSDEFDGFKVNRHPGLTEEDVELTPGETGTEWAARAPLRKARTQPFFHGRIASLQQAFRSHEVAGVVDIDTDTIHVGDDWHSGSPLRQHADVMYAARRAEKEPAPASAMRITLGQTSEDRPRPLLWIGTSFDNENFSKEQDLERSIAAVRAVRQASPPAGTVVTAPLFGLERVPIEQAEQALRDSKHYHGAARAPLRKIKVYRGGGEGQMPFWADTEDDEPRRRATAQDVLDYENNELENEDVVPEPGVDLSSILASRLRWVTFQREAAQEYVNPEDENSSGVEEDEIGENYTIVARDGQGGYLIALAARAPLAKAAITFKEYDRGDSIEVIAIGGGDGQFVGPHDIGRITARLHTADWLRRGEFRGPGFVVRTIDVEPEYRRQGIAGQLYQRLAALARKRGIKLHGSTALSSDGQALRAAMTQMGGVGPDNEIQMTAAAWLQKRTQVTFHGHPDFRRSSETAFQRTVPALYDTRDQSLHVGVPFSPDNPQDENFHVGLLSAIQDNDPDVRAGHMIQLHLGRGMDTSKRNTVSIWGNLDILNNHGSLTKADYLKVLRSLQLSGLGVEYVDVPRLHLIGVPIQELQERIVNAPWPPENWNKTAQAWLRKARIDFSNPNFVNDLNEAQLALISEILDYQLPGEDFEDAAWRWAADHGYGQKQIEAVFTDLAKARLDPSQRVWQGAQQPGSVPSSRAARTAQGAIGERLAAQALQEARGGQYRNLNDPGQRPAPLDLLGPDLGVEVKTGTAARAGGSWKVTLGAIGPKERALLETFTDEERAEYWTKKKQMALDRKEQLLRKLSAQVGRELSGVTVGVILSPDGTRGDVFLIQGFHNNLSWQKYATPEAYLGTFGTDTQQADAYLYSNAESEAE